MSDAYSEIARDARAKASATMRLTTPRPETVHRWLEVAILADAAAKDVVTAAWIVGGKVPSE